MMLRNELVLEWIEECVRASALNHFGPLGLPDEPMWQSPLVGFAAGDDPFFRFLQKDIGDFYWSPAEAFHLKYPDVPCSDEELTVISLVFPQTAITKSAQTQEKTVPAPRWIVTRGEWETFCMDFCRSVITRLEAEQKQAVAIDLLPGLTWKSSPQYGRAAPWSHRHTAFVAGLGTFGLSDGLITEKGKAVRITTLLIKEKLDITPRTYQDHHAWCSFFRDGSCGACIQRCPAGAISAQGHDKEKCYAYEETIKKDLVQKGEMNPDYISSCGLCQCQVPCQDKIPVRAGA